MKMKNNSTVKCQRKSNYQANINMHNIITKEYDNCIDNWDDSSADEEYLPKQKTNHPSHFLLFCIILCHLLKIMNTM